MIRDFYNEQHSWLGSEGVNNLCSQGLFNIILVEMELVIFNVAFDIHNHLSFQRFAQKI